MRTGRRFPAAELRSRAGRGRRRRTCFRAGRSTPTPCRPAWRRCKVRRRTTAATRRRTESPPRSTRRRPIFPHDSWLFPVYCVCSDKIPRLAAEFHSGRPEIFRRLRPTEISAVPGKFREDMRWNLSMAPSPGNGTGAFPHFAQFGLSACFQVLIQPPEFIENSGKNIRRQRHPFEKLFRLQNCCNSAREKIMFLLQAVRISEVELWCAKGDLTPTPCGTGT